MAKLIEWSRKYGTKYRVGELVRAGKLFRIEEGIYADVADAPEVEVVLAKYPASVLTLESAYYYYRMSDEIPDEYHLATDRKAATITDVRVVQSYVPSGTLRIGALEMSVWSVGDVRSRGESAYIRHGTSADRDDAVQDEVAIRPVSGSDRQFPGKT